MKATLAAVLVLLSCSSPVFAARLDDDVRAFLNTVAVAGREEAAVALVTRRLGGLPARTDALGNVVLTVGSGTPRRLVACALGEPGLVVSGIREDGFLRVVRAGAEPEGALWTQSFEGQTVVIGGAQGWRPGAVVLPSVHLRGADRLGRDRPFAAEDVYVDVGAENAAEVAALGIRLLDPVGLLRRPAEMKGGLVAAPAAAAKGACAALLDAARRYRPAPGVGGGGGGGTVVFAWTVSDRLNRAGLRHLLRGPARGEEPFAEAILLDSGFGWQPGEGGTGLKIGKLPAPGSGPIGAGTLPAALARLAQARHFEERLPEAGSLRVGYVGLPARYPATPVETIALRDVAALADSLLTALGGTPLPADHPLPELPAAGLPELVETTEGHDEAARLLGTLVARYGVSGAEGPVREEVLRQLRQLPGGLREKAQTDEKGNVTLTLGSGGEPLLFVAHLDEVGFRVEEVLADGRLRLQNRGGLLPTAWEAQAAIVHGGAGEGGGVPGVFEPREDWWTAGRPDLSGPLTAYVGTASAAETAALGIQVGSTVTMPKRMLRLGRHRVVARGFDDRVGSTALLLALRRLDPAKLGRRVTFAWVVEEEVGLHGSTALAERMRDFAAVHPVDTFVSSDSPVESSRYADARLGKGAVLRAMDNGFYAPRPLVDRFLALAERRGIPIQVGFTGGATDGMPFLPDGPAMLPFSWPGRYSHSPVEVADLRDLDVLVELIVATIEEQEE